jgi:alpha,alpha-trehalase
VDIVQRSYTGLEARGDLLRLNPAFPDELRRVNFHLRYRGHWLDLDIVAKRLKIEALQSGARPIKIQIKDQVYDVEQGRTIECDL